MLKLDKIVSMPSTITTNNTHYCFVHLYCAKCTPKTTAIARAR